MVQVQHRKRRHAGVMKPFHCSLVFLLLTLIAMTAFYLQQKLNSSSSSTTRERTTTVSTKLLSRQQNVQCKSHGCPLFPPELTEEIRKEIASDTERTAVFPYGNQHVVGFTQQGKDHAINQDRGVIISPFYARSADSIDGKLTNESTENKDFLIGIFDGHGDAGHVVAQYLQDHFATRLSKKMAIILPENAADTAIIKVLKETFVELDGEIPPDAANDGGSTASVIYRVGSKLFFANTGDSLSFVALHKKGSDGTGSTKIVHRNRYDKAHLPEEKERIEQMGGHISIPQGHPFMSRVNAFYPQVHDIMSLAMSRSIGDWPHGKIGVIPEPIVDVVNLDELFKIESSSEPVSAISNVEDMELFVVSSSDGLYDHRQPQFVADHFAGSLFSENAVNLATQCMNIIDLATPKNPLRYRDDITLMVMRVVM